MGSCQPLRTAEAAADFAYERRAAGPGDYDCSDDPGAFAHFPHAEEAATLNRPAGEHDPLVTAFLRGVAWSIARSTGKP